MSEQTPRAYAHKMKTAAALAGCCVKTLYRAVERGDLKARRWMRHLVVTDEDLRRFINGMGPGNDGKKG